MTIKLNSIGINKDPKSTKVVVAMSGGVDSSTVAGMMKKDGYQVIGITLKLYDDTQQVSKSKQCCAGQDIIDAKRVAHKLNIDHNPSNTQKYGIRGIPTMLLFSGGELKATKVGATTKSNIVSWIKENI